MPLYAVRFDSFLPGAQGAAQRMRAPDSFEALRRFLVERIPQEAAWLVPAVPRPELRERLRSHSISRLLAYFAKARLGETLSGRVFRDSLKTDAVWGDGRQRVVVAPLPPPSGVKDALRRRIRAALAEGGCGDGVIPGILAGRITAAAARREGDSCSVFFWAPPASSHERAHAFARRRAAGLPAPDEADAA